MHTPSKKSKKMKSYLFPVSLLLLLQLLACQSSSPKEATQEAFELGTTTTGHYHNGYFGLDIYFDPTWNVQEKEQLELMEQAGEELLVGDNKNLKAALDAATINTAYLLTIFKYPLGTKVDYNPNFVALVENVSNFSDIETGANYLFHVQQLLAQTALKYQFEEVYEQQVGTKVFHVLDLTAQHKEMEIQQSYWSTIEKGFCLSFILSYHSEQEKEELMAIINQVKI